MRVHWLLPLALVGCMQSDPPYPPGGGGGGGGGTGLVCQADTDCAGGQVCARTGQCVQPSDVHTVHVTWTLQGQPASTATCASSSQLEIDFPSGPGGDGGWWGWAPVPCDEGKFTVDKLPTWFPEADVSIDGDPGSTVTAQIDASTGLATLDLPY